MPYSREISGRLYIANHDLLVNDQNGRFDVVIVEAKTGNTDKPNGVWKDGTLRPIEYIVRFVGFYDDEDKIEEIASQLASSYFYEDCKSRIRYIIVAEQVNDHYQNKGVTYITYSDIIEFLVRIRGESWLEAGIGVASLHRQWDPLISQVFEIANSHELPIERRCRKIACLFA
jgi:hypothetical protein